jgi:hypothetical protein
MKWETTRLQTFLSIVSALIMISGLGCAAYLYQKAVNEPADVLGDQAERSSVYQIQPEDSKKYQRDMEAVSGKAGLVVAEFRSKLAALWEGKSLAYMVAAMSILISFAFYFAANHLPEQRKPTGRGNAGGDGTGGSGQT